MDKDGWRVRLKAALAERRRSMRAVSLAAGMGESYLAGILNDGKEPSIDNLLAICDHVPVSPLYIILGIDALPEDVEVLRALHKQPERRQAILSLLSISASLKT